MRCFVAIPLSEHVRARVFHEFENLKNKNLFNGKFVEKDNLHLTLKFLGELTEEEIEKVKEKLHEVDFEKFRAEIGDVGFFDENYIRVIWVDFVSDKINRLAEKVREKTFDFSSDKKEFVSHITTARVNSLRDKDGLLEEVRKMNFKNLEFEIDNFVLMKSELHHEGPKYKVLENFELK